MNEETANRQREADPATAPTAVHEAGHAVIALVLRRGVTRVSIVPEGSSLGHVEYAPPLGTGLAVRYWRDRVVIALAGLEAEAQVTGIRLAAYGHPDYADAFNMFPRAKKAGDSDDDLWQVSHRRCRRLVARHLPTIEAFASELRVRRTLTGREARTVFAEEMMWSSLEAAKAELEMRRRS